MPKRQEARWRTSPSSEGRQVTMRERFDEQFGKGHVSASMAVAFAESEVRLALQPLEQAPGLAEAEELLRQGVHTEHSHTRISDELDRLRAEIVELRKLCGRAIRHVILPEVPTGEEQTFNQLVIDLVAASRPGPQPGR